MTIERGNVVTVERGPRRGRAGQGLLQSMLVVWKHWQGSFQQNRGDFSQIHGTFTVEYPEERTTLPETYRNLPILLYDEASGHELCTSCFQCQRICPPQVIHMSQAKDPVTGKALPALAEFVIEYDACMSCGFCAEVCPFDAIKMDHAFELATADHPSLTVQREQLNRPLGYYAAIAPTLWAEVKDGALKKLQANIKRRPDVIGMAPNLVDKIQARRRELEQQAAESRSQEGERAEAQEAAAASQADPVDAKAAKLAAIRAKNAAKQTAPELAAPSAETAAATTETAPAPTTAQDKAAKLAAIRAKNAAKQSAASETPASTPDQTEH